MRSLIMFCFFIISSYVSIGRSVYFTPDSHTSSFSQSKTQNNYFVVELKIHERGFLVFDSAVDLENYYDYLVHNTHATVQGYLQEQGFSSRGTTLYGEEYANETITDEQAINYVLSNQSIFQIEDAIMRPIGDTSCTLRWKFILVMRTDYLNSSSYEKISAGEYDEESMIQVASYSHSESIDTLGLDGFLQNTPIGYQENTPSDCPDSEVAAARRFLGWGYGEIPECGFRTMQVLSVISNTYVTKYRRCDRGSYFIFGFRIRNVDNTEHCWWADGCQ